ncbi:hypothetical protein CSA17_04175 [bacterium DOLJORAL78_65_58]|nr:MAG: hypothetical protein CSB20_08975 [bacterium DOLZORAL124_64_63]PIE76066.1 MAG: hypothetical protein CSA17_04175 [bacterium DOLJORAL78_65_58]
MKRLTTLTFILAFWALPAMAIQLIPSDDMYSDPNHGSLPNTATELWCATFNGAAHYERIMIKFDQAELEAIGAGVSSAVLNLYRFFGCPGHPYTTADVYAGTQDWSEDTWPVPNHLPHEANSETNITFGPSSGWYQIDITNLVNDWISGNRENCGLVIQARPGQRWSKFYSKDHPSPSFHPFLEIEADLSGVPAADPAMRMVCAPNPFNPRTTVSFRVAKTGPVRVEVFDLHGRLLTTLTDRVVDAGPFAVDWDGRDGQARPVPAGTYIVAATMAGQQQTTRISLVK